MPVWDAPETPAGWAVRAAPSLVGRERELLVLEQAWRATLEGARQVVFVGGEPGAGKSRLAAEVVTTLHAEGAAVLVGSCIPDLGGPYEPFVTPVDVLHRVLLEDPAALGLRLQDARAISDPLSALLGRAPDGGTATSHQRQLYDAVVDLVVAAASRRPVVLVLEDLHLGGPATLQLLGYLVERSAGSRLLVVVTHRTTPADRSADLVRAISSLYALDGVRRLDLAGLDTEAIGRYLVLEGGQRPDRAAPLAALLRDATGGNPFFLRETWRDLSGEGGPAAMRSGRFPVPQSVLHTLHGRLERLEPVHRRTVEVAAVLGGELDVAAAAEVAEVTAQQCLEAVDRAVELGLMTAGTDADGSWRFVHSLARQAVLDLMPASRLMATHAGVGLVLERRQPRTDALVHRLAHHFDSAHALGLAGKAVDYLVQAATLAQQTLAHREAAVLLERAAALCTDADQEDDLRLTGARSHLLAGDFSRSQEAYERVASRAGGSRRLLGAIGYEMAGWRSGTPGAPAAQLLADLLQARPLDPADPTCVRALAGLGRALAYTGDGAGETFCRQALAHARALGDDELVGDALEARMGYGHDPANAWETLALADELSRLADRRGAVHQAAAAAYNQAVLGYVLGAPDHVRRGRSDLFRVARLTGQPGWAYPAQAITFGQHLLAGALDDAMAACESMLASGEAAGLADVEGPYGVQSFMVRRESGGLEQVRALVTGHERPEDRWAPGLLALYTELRLTGPTARVLAWLMDDLGSQRGTAQWAGVLALLAEAALWLEDRTVGERLRPLLAEYTGMNLMLGAFDGPMGSADRYLGALDSLLGRGSPDELFAAALDLDTRMAAPVHQAHTLALHAAHLRRGCAPEQDVARLETEARQIAEPAGLVRVLRLLPSPTVQRSEGTAGLTPREVDVVRLLGEGRTNRQIAALLRISENTAANHVRSILVKTGSGNRTQAAIYGRERC